MIREPFTFPPHHLLKVSSQLELASVEERSVLLVAVSMVCITKGKMEPTVL